MKTEYGLYTPTDWNRECELLKEYLQHLQSFKTPLEIMQIFLETALLFGYDKPLTFEQWKMSFGYDNKNSLLNRVIL